MVTNPYVVLARWQRQSALLARRETELWRALLNTRPVLRKLGKQAAELDDVLADLLAQIRRATTLLDDVLQFSRLTLGPVHGVESWELGRIDQQVTRMLAVEPEITAQVRVVQQRLRKLGTLYLSARQRVGQILNDLAQVQSTRERLRDDAQRFPAEYFDELRKVPSKHRPELITGAQSLAATLTEQLGPTRQAANAPQAADEVRSLNQRLTALDHRFDQTVRTLRAYGERLQLLNDVQFEATFPALDGDLVTRQLRIRIRRQPLRLT